MAVLTPFPGSKMLIKNVNNRYSRSSKNYASYLARQIKVRRPWRHSSLRTYPETWYDGMMADPERHIPV